MNLILGISWVKRGEEMKILVGVDTAHHYQSTVNLAVRLQVPEPEWTVAHSVEVHMPIVAYGSAAESAYREEFVQVANVAGENALDDARHYMHHLGFEPEVVLLAGGAAEALAHFADDAKTDLIVVHSERKGRLGSFFLGSVSRGLAIVAHQSVLISKGQISPTGPIRAVFATDHSEYANRALQKLIDLKLGLSHIEVISVLHIGSKVPVDQPDPIYSSVSVEEALWQEAKVKTDAVVAKLIEAGYSANGKTVDAHINEGLHKAMLESQAELMILGAQGHGVMHRVMLGSVSLHQVVVEPYSVLILRA